MDQKKQKAARALKQDPRHSIREICEIVGISRNTYYKDTTYTRADDTPRPSPPRRPAPSGDCRPAAPRW